MMKRAKDFARHFTPTSILPRQGGGYYTPSPGRRELVTAKQHGVEPTPPGRASMMRFTGSTVGSLADLIAGTQRGILVTNFWYIRYVNPTDLTLTGMTRDGTFLIEDGKVTTGVKNFRFHESPLRAFLTVDAATAPMECITNERGKMMLPAVRLPKFRLSSVTKF